MIRALGLIAVCAVIVGLTWLFLDSVNQAFQDADKRAPAEHPRTYPSTSMHREGTP